MFRRPVAFACLLLGSACPSDPVPIAEDGSSGTSTTGGTSTNDETVTPTTMSSTDGPSSTTIDPDTTAGETNTDATTAPPPMCDAPDGTYGDPCPEDAPFCVGGMCNDCDDDAPETSCVKAEGAPGSVCAPDGRCVVCTPEDAAVCQGATPICDPETSTCAPCTAHDQCDMGAACNLFTGQCVEGPVVDAVPGAGSLAAAVASVGAGGTIIVADGTYDEMVTIGSGAIVAFIAAPAASPEWRRTSGVGAPQLRVTGAATVLVDGIAFRLNDSTTDPALRIDGADSRAWLDRSSIAQNFGVGVRAEVSAELVMRNCFAGGANNIDALDVTGATATVRYSTLAAAFGSSNAISCDAASVVTVSDSILLAQDSTAEVACDVIAADHTVTNDMVLAGAGNLQVGATDEAWFANYGTGDLHLVGDGVTAFAAIGEWNEGDPTVDIDGDPRPSTDPSQDYPGADIP